MSQFITTQYFTQVRHCSNCNETQPPSLWLLNDAYLYCTPCMRSTRITLFAHLKLDSFKPIPIMIGYDDVLLQHVEFTVTRNGIV